MQGSLLDKVRDASASGKSLGARSGSHLRVIVVVVRVGGFHVKDRGRGKSVTVMGRFLGGAGSGCLACCGCLVVENLVKGHLAGAFSENGPDFVSIGVNYQSRRNQQTLLIRD